MEATQDTWLYFQNVTICTLLCTLSVQNLGGQETLQWDDLPVTSVLQDFTSTYNSDSAEGRWADWEMHASTVQHVWLVLVAALQIWCGLCRDITAAAATASLCSIKAAPAGRLRQRKIHDQRIRDADVLELFRRRAEHALHVQ